MRETPISSGGLLGAFPGSMCEKSSLFSQHDDKMGRSLRVYTERDRSIAYRPTAPHSIKVEAFFTQFRLQSLCPFFSS